MNLCPNCKTLNSDNWPITVNGAIMEGGCQDCWEKESDMKWWEAVIALDTVLNPID